MDMSNEDRLEKFFSLVLKALKSSCTILESLWRTVTDIKEVEGGQGGQKQKGEGKELEVRNGGGVRDYGLGSGIGGTGWGSGIGNGSKNYWGWE